jgi:hypothetical protein
MICTRERSVLRLLLSVLSETDRAGGKDLRDGVAQIHF